MRVQSIVPLANSLGELPAGTKWTVEEAFHGLSLKSDACECCGIQVRMRHVPTCDVVPVGSGPTTPEPACESTSPA
jgi:hypothetical protein